MQKTHVFGLSKKSWIYTVLVVIGITIFVSWLLLRLLGAYAFGLSLGDIVHEDISFSESQRLTPFEICLPTYLPASVNPNPQITYRDDDGRGQIKITLDYFVGDTHNPILQIQQWNVSESREFLPLENAEVEVRDLLAWQVGFDKAFEFMDEVVSEKSVLQEKSENRGLVEVLTPSELKGNSVFWVHSGVVYRVFTRLSTEEAVRVAKDLDNCRK